MKKFIISALLLFPLLSSMVFAGTLDEFFEKLAIIGISIIVIGLVISLLIIAGTWKIFVKAGVPGWYSIIPILNTIYLLKISNKPTWWLFLLFIPGVNLFVAIAVFIELAASFNKGFGYALGLLLFPFIFFPLLGFGDDVYKGTVSNS